MISCLLEKIASSIWIWQAAERFGDCVSYALRLSWQVSCHKEEEERLFNWLPFLFFPYLFEPLEFVKSFHRENQRNIHFRIHSFLNNSSSLFLVHFHFHFPSDFLSIHTSYPSRPNKPTSPIPNLSLLLSSLRRFSNMSSSSLGAWSRLVLSSFSSCCALLISRLGV